MRGQLLVLGMSDSGTNWLMRSIQATTIFPLRYFREFFNPICNLKHAKKLSEGWGCEVPSTIPMIARPAETQPRLHEIYNETWRREDFNCTKENYSVWKVPFLLNYFDIIGIYREPASLWPPARYRVVTWYNAVYESIRHNLREYEPRFQEKVLSYGDGLTIAERAEAGHFLAITMMLEQAGRWHFPVMSYSWLSSASEASLVEWAQTHVVKEYVDPEKGAREIVNTRRPPDKSDLTDQWLACRRKGGA